MKNVLIALLCLLAIGTFSQEDTLTKKEIRKQKKADRPYGLAGYPLLFFSPETNFGFGAAGALSFKAGPQRDTSLNDSQIILGGAYTLEKQLLLYLPWKIFWEENKNYSFGEVGYFKYFYAYWGNGPNSLAENVDTFKVDFPRLRIHYTRKIGDHLSLGGALWFEDFKIGSSIGNLVENSFGGQGGITHGIGPLAVFDNRNHVFYPTKGWYIEAKALGFHNAIGSDYNFIKGGLDVVNYSTVHKNGVLASHFNYQFIEGSAPFNMLSVLGGTKRMRGYYEGRFRDNHAMIFQAEYRLQLPWRLGLVAFGDVGQVFNKFSYLKGNEWRWTAGGGIRFMLDPKRKINIRLDYGLGKETSGFYLTIGEAF
ncbi:MAG: hypothetical protein ACI857_002866 [Arenicella sp.]|jgi:hypothetical protein